MQAVSRISKPSELESVIFTYCSVSVELLNYMKLNLKLTMITFTLHIDTNVCQMSHCIQHSQPSSTFYSTSLR